MQSKGQLATRLGLAVLMIMAFVLGGCGGGGSSSGAAASTAGGTATVSSTTSSTTASSTGTATLSWSAPTENVDGTPITGLAGYRVYYGTSADALTESIDVAGATTTTYVINDLSPGTYYFTVTAYNAQGIESDQSNVASKTI
jgi:hypothetical protein